MAFARVSFIPNAQELLKRLTDAVNLLSDGRSNAVGSLTLTAATTTTEITDRRVGIDSHIGLSPTTANAAAALATTYVSEVTAEAFTLTHANNAQTDRTFDYTITG